MPNISAYNCADYEVNLSATKRMSRHSFTHSLATREQHSEYKWQWEERGKGGVGGRLIMKPSSGRWLSFLTATFG